MGKSSSGPYFQVHIPDVRNTKLLRIAKQQLVNGHHVEEGCQACRGHIRYLSRVPLVYPCKFFLAGVNFYRFNAKNWHF